MISTERPICGDIGQITALPVMPLFLFGKITCNVGPPEAKRKPTATSIRWDKALQLWRTLWFGEAVRPTGYAAFEPTNKRVTRIRFVTLKADVLVFCQIFSTWTKTLAFELCWRPQMGLLLPPGGGDLLSFSCSNLTLKQVGAKSERGAHYSARQMSPARLVYLKLAPR